MKTFVEANCVVSHEGKTFEAGGAVVTPTHIVAYPGDDGVLKDWHGNAIGTWRAVASWRVGGFVSDRMYQIEATVAGVTYTGRGAGKGMIYRGRAKRS